MGDEGLLERLRAVMAGRTDVVEKRMVGGRSFSLNDQMCCGVTKAGLMVRVQAPDRAAVLAEPHVQPLMIGTKQPASFVIVEAAGVATQSTLERWVERAIEVVSPVDRSPEDRFAELAERFEGIPGVLLPGEGGGPGFGAKSLRINGSIFAMVTRGRLVVKLSRTRVQECIEAGVGEAFTAGKDVAMKEWLTVTDRADWAVIAHEAMEFVGS